MKTVLRELIRSASLIFLLGAPWAIVSSPLEGSTLVILLVGMLPASHYLVWELLRESASGLRSDDEAASADESEPPSTRPQLRLVATVESPRLPTSGAARG